MSEIKKYGFTKIMRFLSIFLLFASLALQAVESCEDVEPDKAHPILTMQFQPIDIQYDLEKYSHFNDTMAKGIVGELTARRVIESQDWEIDGWQDIKLVSLEAYFQSQNCQMGEFLRDSSNHGIDDIFVALQGGQINRSISPIFHEAKFNGSCNLKLGSTRHICEQLSIQWTSFHLQGIGDRIVSSVCFGGPKEIRFVKDCVCAGHLYEEVNWLKDKFATDQFHRTTSLLCKNGKFVIYPVKKK